MKTTIIISLLSLASLTAGAQTATKTITSSNHAVCMKAPDMPANAKLVFPKAAYTPVQDPSCPPCYEYTTKRGLKVMECPFLWFPPEGGNSKVTPTTDEPVSTIPTDMQTQNAFTMQGQ